MADHRNDIVLRQEGEPLKGNEWLDELKDACKDLCGEAPTAGKNWIKGKGEQEVNKAAEIKARVLTALGNLEIEQKRLVQERENAEDQHDQKMRELETDQYRAETERYKAKAEAQREWVKAVAEVKANKLKLLMDATKLLNEAGVHVSISNVMELYASLAGPKRLKSESGEADVE